MFYGNNGGGLGLYVERIETHVLALLVRDGTVLLGRPHSGPDRGLRTGIGGAIGRRGKEAAIVYHCQRLLGVSLPVEQVRFAGRKEYQLHNGHRLRRVEVFTVDSTGVELVVGPGFTDPQWYRFDQLPNRELSLDDRMFLPKLLHSPLPPRYAYVVDEETGHAALTSINFFDSA